MKIRVYCWERYITPNIFYRFRHPEAPGLEHYSGVTKIEYEADNGNVHIFEPLSNQYFDTSHVNAVILKCKNCNTVHVMLKEDNVPMQVQFTNPCHCGNINTDSYRASGGLICYRPLPVFERITDYTYNSKHEIKVEKFMNEDTYQKVTTSLLVGLQSSGVRT